MKLVYLDVMSYRVSANPHYWGKLKCRGEESIELAMRLKSTDLWAYSEPDYTWQVGDRSSRFPSYDRLKRLALKFCGIHIPDAILVEGDSWAHQPMEILNKPGGLDVHKLNAMWKECERLGWWDYGNEDKVQKLSDEWFKSIKGATDED